jgi:hypothetical protein
MQNSAKIGKRNRNASLVGPILINIALNSDDDWLEKKFRNLDTAVGKNLELM